MDVTKPAVYMRILGMSEKTLDPGSLTKHPLAPSAIASVALVNGVNGGNATATLTSSFCFSFSHFSSPDD